MLSVRGWRGREDDILTLQHLDCNSGAGGTFLDAKGSCFYHLTERSPSQWIAFRKKQLPCLKIKNCCLTVPPHILLIKSQLTKLQPVPRELPFVGVVREPFTLLIHRHVLRVQDHRQVARLQISTIWLKEIEGVKENMCETMSCCLSQFSPFINWGAQQFPSDSGGRPVKGAQSALWVYVTYASREWPCCS